MFSLYLQIAVSLLLIILVLLQVKAGGMNRSASQSSFTRRGLENFIFKLTFVITAVFLIISAINLFI